MAHSALHLTCRKAVASTTSLVSRKLTGNTTVTWSACRPTTIPPSHRSARTGG